MKFSIVITEEAGWTKLYIHLKKLLICVGWSRKVFRFLTDLRSRMSPNCRASRGRAWVGADPIFSSKAVAALQACTLSRFPRAALWSLKDTCMMSFYIFLKDAAAPRFGTMGCANKRLNGPRGASLRRR